MASTYITQSEAAVAYNKRYTQRKVNAALDDLWERVDAHGYPEGASNEYARGHYAACTEILAMIEQAGGMFHGARRVHDFIDNANRIAAE